MAIVSHCPLKTPALTCPLPALASAGTYIHKPAVTVWSLQAPTVSSPLLLSGLCRHLHSHAHGPRLSPAGSFTLSTVPFGLCKHQHSLICMLPLFVLYKPLHSQAHCSPLASAGICTHLPTTLLCLLLPPTLLCPLFPSGFPRHLHSYPFCLSLTSAGTDTHIPNVPFPHAHFRHLSPLTHTSLWPLQAATLMYPLPSSGLCKHPHSSAHCASVASASTYTHMTNADLAS